MKKLITAIAIILSLKARAQTVHVDSAINQAYVNITPINLSFLGGTVQLKRLYINIQQYVPMYFVRFGWSLNYANVIDSVTTNYQPLISGTVSLPILSDLTLSEATEYLFNYVPDSATYNNIPLNVIITD